MSEPDAVPLPREGEVFFDVRGEARCMRLSWYADSAVAVFSIWQGNRCTGTFRLPFNDLDRMVCALQSGPAGPAVTGQPDFGYLDRDPAPAYDGVHGHRDSSAGQHFYQAEPWHEPEQQAGPAYAGPGYSAGPAYAGPQQHAQTWDAGPGYPEGPAYAGPGYPEGPAYAGPGYPDEPANAGPQQHAQTWHAEPGYPAEVGQGYPPGHGLAEPGYPADPWYTDSWQTDSRSAARYAGP